MRTNSRAATAAAGQAALAAWELGEGPRHDYAPFKMLLAPEFRVFSHPSLERGYHTGPEARQRLDALIATRETRPNRLVFSNQTVVTGSPQADGTRWVVLLFDAVGSTFEKPHYCGYNAIGFLLDPDNRLIGFREYFGDVQPGS